MPSINFRTAVPILLTCLFSMSNRCTLFQKNQETATTTIKQDTTDWHSGTVRDKRGLDGCTYILELDEDTRLEPVNLPEKYQKEGLQLRFIYKPLHDRMSICMVGKIVELLEMELIE